MDEPPYNDRATTVDELANRLLADVRVQRQVALEGMAQLERNEANLLLYADALPDLASEGMVLIDRGRRLFRQHLEILAILERDPFITQSATRDAVARLAVLGCGTLAQLLYDLTRHIARTKAEGDRCRARLADHGHAANGGGYL